MGAKFRTTATSKEGSDPAHFLECRVINLNLVNWTVDVSTVFDQRHYFDIQVASPYLHGSNGEGIYVVPELGAKCFVCLPGDSSPPFVSSFIMPFESVDLATTDNPRGITSQSSDGAGTSGASFAGGRARAKPGDIIMRGRDGNFAILHRGGVLQLGASELSQRIFIPLNNVVMDISDNYYHHNAGGTEYWGMQPSPTQDKYPSEYTHTFRIFANDKYADVRVKAAKVQDPFNGVLDKDLKLTDVVYEVTVAPQGFDPTTGQIKDAKALTQRFAFDKTGNALLGGTGELSVYFKKRIHLHSATSISIESDKSFDITAKTTGKIDGGDTLILRGGVIKMGPASSPVAKIGSIVSVTLPFTPVPVPGSPPLKLTGVISSGGSDTILV